MMIAVTGANGRFGRAAIRFLSAQIHPQYIIAVVRDASRAADLKNQGLQIRIADYDDPASLEKAFQGAERLLHVSASTSGETARIQEDHVVQSAIRAGVRHVVYTSTLSPSPQARFLAGRTCYETEQAYIRSGITHSFLRNSMYHETIPLFIGDALQNGTIYFSAGGGRVSFASRNDMARAAAKLLAVQEPQSGIYPLTGAQAFSFPELAEMLSGKTGRKISYSDIPPEVLKEELIKAGMPVDEADFYLSMAASIRGGEFAATDQTLKKLVQKRPSTVEEYMNASDVLV